MAYTGERKREYQRQWVAERRATWFKDKHCVDCGSTVELELDHVDPNEKVSHRIWSWSWKRILEETSKCVVRCKQHHRERSNEQLSRPITHGDTGYRRGCRCSICRTVHYELHKKYRINGTVADEVLAPV